MLFSLFFLLAVGDFLFFVVPILIQFQFLVYLNMFKIIMLLIEGLLDLFKFSFMWNKNLLLFIKTRLFLLLYRNSFQIVSLGGLVFYFLKRFLRLLMLRHIRIDLARSINKLTCFWLATCTNPWAVTYYNIKDLNLLL